MINSINLKAVRLGEWTVHTFHCKDDQLAWNGQQRLSCRRVVAVAESE